MSVDRRLFVGDRTEWTASRRGALLLFVALAMFALTALLAIAIDGGIMQQQRRMTQKAADAAALAGGQEIFRNRADLAVASATAEAARNGFTDGMNGAVVTVNKPPQPPTRAIFQDNNHVQVIVQSGVSSVFARVFGRNSLTVRSSAVGGSLTSATPCVTTLDPGMQDAIWINSSAHVAATNCNVVVNSSNPSEAMYVANGTSISTNGTGTIGVVGLCNCIGSVSPSVIHVSPAPDPLASVSLPTSATDHCDFGTDGHLTTYSATQTIDPGVYCGGIKVTKSTTTLTMNPGLYVMKGGGFMVQSAIITGTGVSIGNISGLGGVTDFQPFDITSNSFNVTAMTSGPLAGILLYSPRGQGSPTKAPQKNRIHSDAAVQTMGGSIYLPDQEMSLESGFSMNVYGGITVGDLRVANGTVNVDPSLGPLPPGQLARAAVVE